MNLKHEQELVRLHSQEYLGMVIYWRKAWHARKISGWVVLGIKMKPVGLEQAKKKVEREIQNG